MFFCPALGQEPDTGKDYKTPAQDEVAKQIAEKSALIIKLTDVKDSGLATKELLAELTAAKKDLKLYTQKQKTLISDANRQRKRRLEEKDIRMRLAAESEENSKKLKKFTHEKAGRPPVEDTYPDLHAAIVALASAGAGADGRRRTEILNSCSTLDDLRAALLKDGYVLSRQALYLRLIPRRRDSIEGKRHIRTVPVKIRKATNNLRKKHVDADFTFANKTYLQDIATLFGPESVFVLSIDDKAKVPLGITAATRQAPLVMHMEYEVRLPDHDFVVATKHKLIPSVYAACEIQSASAKSQPEISYTGALYVAIRSLKHDSSTAFTHGRDFDHVMGLEEFASVARNGDQVKPIVLAFVDGGPDENPRFPKVLSVAIDHFRYYISFKYDWDLLPMDIASKSPLTPGKLPKNLGRATLPPEDFQKVKNRLTPKTFNNMTLA